MRYVTQSPVYRREFCPIVKQIQTMEKRVINPWYWQNERSYVQAVEVKQVTGTLYCSGQAAVDADGRSSTADMRTQLAQAIDNLEQVIREADYECRNIVRLTVYTTSTDAFMTSFDLLQAWIAKHSIQQATTLLEVNRLFETLQVELEATVVK